MSPWFAQGARGSRHAPAAPAHPTRGLLRGRPCALRRSALPCAGDAPSEIRSRGCGAADAASSGRARAGLGAVWGGARLSARGVGSCRGRGLSRGRGTLPSAPSRAPAAPPPGARIPEGASPARGVAQRRRVHGRPRRAFANRVCGRQPGRVGCRKRAATKTKAPTPTQPACYASAYTWVSALAPGWVTAP